MQRLYDNGAQIFQQSTIHLKISDATKLTWSKFHIGSLHTFGAAVQNLVSIATWDLCRVRLEPDGTRWRTGGEVKGKLANGVGSQYSHTTSKHGVSSITNADAHTSAASSRLNWCPRRFKWTRPFQRKMKAGFCACHHVSNAVYIALIYRYVRPSWLLQWIFLSAALWGRVVRKIIARFHSIKLLPNSKVNTSNRVILKKTVSVFKTTQPNNPRDSNLKNIHNGNYSFHAFIPVKYEILYVPIHMSDCHLHT